MKQTSIKRKPSPVPRRSTSPRPTEVKKFLIVLDFDWTIVEGTCWAVAKKALQKRLGISKSGKNSKGLSQDNIVCLLRAHGGVEEDISKAVKRIPPTANMLPFIRSLPKLDGESIIISDAHPFFMKTWLRSRGVLKVFNCIIGHQSDPVPKTASTTENEKDEELWCSFCSKHMCKGLLLKEFIRVRKQEGLEFRRVVYIGDGKNDYCPVLRLRASDIVFARDGLDLHTRLMKREYDVAAVTYFWKSADQIGSVLKFMNEIETPALS